MTTRLRPKVLLALVLLTPSLSFSQTPEVTVAIDDAAVLLGEPITVEMVMSSVNTLSGWNIGVCHDPDLVTLDEVHLGSGILDYCADHTLPWTQIHLHDEGWTAAVVFGVHAGCIPLLPQGNFQIHEAFYTAGTTEGISTLTFCNSIGSPPPDLGFYNSVGQAQETDFDDGSIEIVPPPPFVRGDCDGDGSLGLVDAIYSHDYLFIGGEEPPCLDACDTNDDSMLTIADPIYWLITLFLAGPPLPPPYPGCGEDPTGDPFDCASYDAVCP